jgi:protein-S-isoprenylcysteine O-methyltransferase Ste14
VRQRQETKGYAETASSPLYDTATASLRRAERREWGLWIAAVVVTLMLTAAVVSFIFPDLAEHTGPFSWVYFPQAIRGPVAVVLLFDLYTIYQQWQIHRIRPELFSANSYSV